MEQLTLNASLIPKSKLLRKLREEEKRLITDMLSEKIIDLTNAEIDSALVIDLNDGNMGSIRFIYDTDSTYQAQIASAEYADSDGAIVSIAINTNTQGNLYEIDFWKTDFSALLKYPTPEKLIRHKEQGASSQ